MKYRTPRIEEFVPGFKYQERYAKFGFIDFSNDKGFTPSSDLWSEHVVPENREGSIILSMGGNLFNITSKDYAAMIERGSVRVPVPEEGEYGAYRADETINQLTI